MIALVVITDGRTDYSERCAETVANLGAFDRVLLVDDSGDRAHTERAWELFSPDVTERHTEPMGGSASIRTAWAAIRRWRSCEWVFHLEDDFTIPAPVDVAGMIAALDDHPTVANMVLRRQPWGTEGPGGYIGDNPQAFADRGGWVEHTLGFWLNPCVYSVEVPAVYDWAPNWHEHHFSRSLEGRTFGVWGTHDDPPACIHIGERRRSPAVDW